MQIEIVQDYDVIGMRAADLVAEQIHKKPDTVLGLATGGTPLGMYHNLILKHQHEGLDFSKVTTFNLDEYIGLPPGHKQSYHHFMWQNFFEHVNVNPASVYIPSGMTPNPGQFCTWYERQIESFGGIDLQVLGIGINGHLAFNEPGSSLGSRTRVTTLAGNTIEANARFFDQESDVPRFAITMGIGTIMESRKLLLLANGLKKAAAIKATIEGALTAMVPASIIQMHPAVKVILDEEAASDLEHDYQRGIAEAKSDNV